MTRNSMPFVGLALWVGVLGCSSSSEQNGGDAPGKQEAPVVAATKEDLHPPKPLTPDEFGRDLFEILKTKDYAGVKRYLWQEQDYLYLAKPGRVFTKEEQEDLSKQNERVWKKVQEGITQYHDRYFKVGAVSEKGEPIRTVEYVRFVPRNATRLEPNHARYDQYVGYNDSHLVIKINGTLEESLEIDHIGVLNGAWRISEIK